MQAQSWPHGGAQRPQRDSLRQRRRIFQSQDHGPKGWSQGSAELLDAVGADRFACKGARGRAASTVQHEQRVPR